MFGTIAAKLWRAKDRAVSSQMSGTLPKRAPYCLYLIPVFDFFHPDFCKDLEKAINFCGQKEKAISIILFRNLAKI